MDLLRNLFLFKLVLGLHFCWFPSLLARVETYISNVFIGNDAPYYLCHDGLFQFSSILSILKYAISYTTIFSSNFYSNENFFLPIFSIRIQLHGPTIWKHVTKNHWMSMIPLVGFNWWVLKHTNIRLPFQLVDSLQLLVSWCFFFEKCIYLNGN